MVECLDELQKIFLRQKRTCVRARNPLLSTISTATTLHSCHRVFISAGLCAWRRPRIRRRECVYVRIAAFAINKCTCTNVFGGGCSA